MTVEHHHIGAVIAGKYRIDRLIGEGGMGFVYEGLHLDLAKRVAVKVIDSAADASAELTARFRREARAASAVECDNIVQVFDVGRDPNVGLYLVMELLHGEDLEMRLARAPDRRLDPMFVAQIGYQVARALVKAHAARVVHRDLKPANIFLTEREDGSLRVKVLDFGISKLLVSDSFGGGKDGALTAAGVAVGTPQYMSPEQAQGLTTVDHRTDVWGVGVVLYEALAGVPAYSEGDSYQRTLLNIMTQRPEHLRRIAPWVPRALADVIAQAMTPELDTRISDAATLAARIAEVIPEAAVTSSGPFAAIARTGSVPSFGQAVTNPRASRPGTLGDDTQVVVRTSNAAFGDADSSRTVPALSAAPSSAKPHASRRGAHADEQAPHSTGEPTMFQPPAWVEPLSGTGTVKSVVTGPAAAPSRMSAVSSGILTALGVLVVGGALVLYAGGGLSRTADESVTASAPGVAPSPRLPATGIADHAPTNELAAAAPPATGTAAVPDEDPPVETLKGNDAGAARFAAGTTP
jgi:serine/threonine protein kinase